MIRSGKKILVTRPIHQADNICKLIEQQGWEAVRFPLIEIQARALSPQELGRLQKLDQYQLVFFVSANAVNFALALINGKMDNIHKALCIVVGKASYNALKAHGIRHVLVAEQGFNSEAVLAMAETQDLQGQCCLIVRGEGGRELLADSLRARGSRVDYLEVYKRRMPVSDSRLINEYLQHKALTAILIYSGDALKNLVQMPAKTDINKNLLNTPVVVISQRVQGLAKKIGFKHIIIAAEASDTAMMNALLNGEECG